MILTIFFNFQNPVVLAEVSFLTIGIPGAVVISVFSSFLVNSGFVVPRTVKATAVLFAEPSSMPSPRSKMSSFTQSQIKTDSCDRPLIPLGRKVKIAEQKLSPILDKISKPLNTVQSKIQTFSAKVFDKLGLQCLIPKVLRKLQPYISRISCKLGFNDDGFMQVPSCNSDLCSKSETEEKEITRHLDAPILDVTDMQVRTTDDCFPDMHKVSYGSRIIAKLVDDQSCDDPQFASICDELFSQDRIIMQESCENFR